MMIGKHYKLLKEIGSGTFGKVYLSEHLPTGRSLAIKVLEKEKIVDDSDVERVSRELRIAQSIAHPHLVQLYHLLETNEYIFLIMEFLPGGELYDYIVSQKRLSEEETFMYFIQVVSAVEYLHSLNIVHRDLKPENLLLDKNKKMVKLVDFGLGRFYEQDAKIETACGSPCYAPPEMLSKLKYDPIKADIWSLGIVLFAMLAGFLPFDDENTDLLYKKIIEGKFKMPGSISLDVADLLSKIIHTDPEKRLSLAEIKNHPWWIRNLMTLRAKTEHCCLGESHIDLLEVNMDLVKKLAKEGGYDQGFILHHVKNRIYSDVFCHYQLLRLNVQTVDIKFKEPATKADVFKKKKVPGTQEKLPLKFRSYRGPIDLDFISIKRPEELLREIKDLFKRKEFVSDFETEFGTGSISSPKFDISFKINVMQFVDFEEGSCVTFENFFPSKIKFEGFYSFFLRDKLKQIIT
jgi:serine/threonine protein kinase